MTTLGIFSKTTSLLPEWKSEIIFFEGNKIGRLFLTEDTCWSEVREVCKYYKTEIENNL